MDIGDPSEIPAGRKPLPSMQELGAFDIDAGHAPARPARRARPLPAGGCVPPTRHPDPRQAGEAPPTGSAALSATGPHGGPDPAEKTSQAPASRVLPTPEQLRAALAKAEPAARQKLLNLIAGGRSIQRHTPGSTDGPGPTGLVMQLERGAKRPAASPLPGSADAPTLRAPGAGPARPPGHETAPTRARPAGVPPDGTLLQIDANTTLLEASSPAPSPADRLAGLQAQLDAARDRGGARDEPAAHKVLFPAYDPARHGEDVHSTVRRRPDPPVEGHFPAPRQPLRTSYRHPDGKPMTPEETKVEDVLQAQRCEATLSVLARDGVNGLLLSPRDLDAAVANGLLSAETAAALWKTWSALRPVIHVIEDPVEEAAPAVAAADGETLPAPDAAQDPGAALPQAVAPRALAITPPSDTSPAPLVASPREPVPGSALAAPAAAPLPAASAAPAAAPLPAPTAAPAAAAPQPPAAPPAKATCSVPVPVPVPEALPTAAVPTLTAPMAQETSAPTAAPTTTAAACLAAPAATRRRGWRAPLRWVLRAFVAYAVIATTLNLGMAFWQTGWGWTLLEQLRRVGP